jgi:4-amino-4-deoxy-L-arabinose transferase-like glycosyltransferase
LIKSAVGIGFAVLLILAAYFSPEIWHHGEAREALVIQDIVINDRWILPLRNGQLPSKPPLYHWIAAEFSMLMGVSAFTVRLPSILSAASLLCLTWSLGSRGGKGTGLLAAGILGSTFEFWDSGTEARVDMLFAAMVSLSLTAWYVWRRSASEFVRVAAYAAAALAVLTKGPAGVVLPVIVVLGVAAVERDFGKVFSFLSWRWLFVVLVIDLGWYVAAYHSGGADFSHKQLVQENIQRFLGTGDFAAQRGNLSMAVWLATKLFPWNIVLLFSVVQWARGRRREPLYHFLHVWWLSIFVFFLIASGQRAVYLLPLYPAVAVITARELTTWLAPGHGAAIGAVRFDRTVILAALIALFNVSFALAVPIRRTIRERNSAQETFVEHLIGIVPPGAPLYAADDFPEFPLMVLAYRLNRSIHRQDPDCKQEYYHLAGETNLSTCSTASPSALLVEHGKRFYLVHNTAAEVTNTHTR